MNWGGPHPVFALSLGLAGAKGPIWGTTRESITGILHALCWHRVVSAAGPSGGILVWRDDNGAWRCTATPRRSFEPRSSEIFPSKRQVHSWLRIWLPVVRRPLRPLSTVVIGAPKAVAA